MNNLVRVLKDGRTAAIQVKYKGETIEALVDIAMLPKVALIPGTWHASATNPTLRRKRDEGDPNAYYIWCQVRGENKDVCTILLHRFIMVAAGQDICDTTVDDKNGITTDCRLTNLQVATTKQNNAKQRLDDRPRSTSKTGIRGVTFKNGKYQVTVSGRYYGRYDTVEEANATARVIRRKLNDRRTGRE